VLDDILILLDRLPLLTLLCTTRTSLRLSQEHQISLGPLSVPEIDDYSADAVRASDAVQLFCDRAAAVLPGFAVTDANARAVAEVCRLLDGQPLALELAAARSRVLKPEDMVLRTGRLLQLLTGGGRDLPTRHRSIRAALDWSAQLLDATEANVFAQLSVFSGGWTVDAAEAVCTADEDIFEVLARLVDKSLVVATGDGRLSMLETVREYAGEQLDRADADPDAATALRSRHARYFAELAEELGPRCRTAPDATTRARLDAEGGNLSAALEHSASVDDGLMLGRLAVGLLDYWFFSCRISQARRWLHIAEAASLPHDLRARLLLSAGNIAFVEGDLARAVPAFTGALQTARALGDHVLIARALTARAVAARHIGHMDEALVFIDEAWLRARDPDVDPDEATLLQGMLPQVENERGEILDGLGRPEEARTHFEAYRQHGIAEGDRSGVAWASLNLALVECAEGRTESAQQYADAAVTAADDGGYAPVRGDARFVAGLVALTDDEPQRAIPLLADAVRLHHSAGQLLTVPDTISLLGVALLQAGRAPEGARMLAAGAAWRSSHGLAVIGRLAQQVIAAAEAQLAAMPSTPQIAADAARGLATPYGSIESLDLPAEDDDQPPVLRLVDVRQRESRLEDIERARLGSGPA
jgi:predicted ATPase